MNNRLANCKNEFQGSAKRVLCVCSAGLLRSPTAAVVLSSAPFNYNTRAAGCEEEFALIPVDEVLLAWADVIVCMSKTHKEKLKKLTKKKIHNLDIADCYEYRDEELMAILKKKFTKLFIKEVPSNV